MIHNDPMDLYRALGLTSSATSEEIAAAFRKRAKETHPDSTGQASADAFREVSDAYDILGDPVRRQEYDRAARELCEQQQAAAEAVKWQQATARAVERQPSLRAFGLSRRQWGAIICCMMIALTCVVTVMGQRELQREAEAIRAWSKAVALSHPGPICAAPPRNGAYIGPQVKASGLYYLEVTNNTEYNMIAKLRDVSSGHVVASLFIEGGHSAAYRGFGDGSYKLQYAFGEGLDVSCAFFLNPIIISESPERVVTPDRVENVFDGKGIRDEYNRVLEDYPRNYHRRWEYVVVPVEEFLAP